VIQRSLETQRWSGASSRGSRALSEEFEATSEVILSCTTTPCDGGAHKLG
jgi:hypothetical protein